MANLTASSTTLWPKYEQKWDSMVMSAISSTVCFGSTKGWLSTSIIAGVLSTEQEHTMCWFSRKYKLASQKEAAISRLYIFVGLSSRSFKPKQRELLPGLVL